MIDFVLVTHITSENRLRLFHQTVDTLFAHTDLDKYANRIVWIDDCSPMFNDWDRAIPFLMQLDNVVVDRNDKQMGVGYSKNKGIEIAFHLNNVHQKVNDLIYMFDADVCFTEGWLEKLLSAYEEFGHKYKIIGGGVHPFLQARANEGSFSPNKMLGVSSHDAISGWSWLLSHEVWTEYGKLADNAIGTGKSEDWEYCQRIRNDNYLVGCIQPQVVAHCGLTNTEGLPIVGYEESKKLAQSVAPSALLL